MKNIIGFIICAIGFLLVPLAAAETIEMDTKISPSHSEKDHYKVCILNNVFYDFSKSLKNTSVSTTSTSLMLRTPPLGEREQYEASVNSNNNNNNSIVLATLTGREAEVIETVLECGDTVITFESDVDQKTGEKVIKICI